MKLHAVIFSSWTLGLLQDNHNSLHRSRSPLQLHHHQHHCLHQQSSAIAVAIDGMTDTINSLSQETPSLPWLHMRSFVGPRSMSWKTFEAGLEFEIARISAYR